ncbi:MAG: Rpn family recombination-promoting nuclease/putative transposase [Bacteroidales bacterium]|nr:Rpn family recombination-promoting nuclease/putative transposase [Bacteroidales bacterium]
MARKYRNFVYDENQRFIYPTSDWGFKYLLGSEENKDILLELLNRLFPDYHIESLEFLPRDITIPVGKMRDASFDVHCRLRDGSRMVIEMQNYVKSSFFDRSTIYTAAAILDHYVNSRTKGYSIGKTIFLAFAGDPLFKTVGRTPVRLAMCDIDEPQTTQRNDKVLQIFIELPKFAGSLQEIDEDTPFLEKLSYVLMEMADCEDIPDNLNDPLLERLFKAADTARMKEDTKESYMKSILGEAEYEANLEDWKAEGLAEGLKEGMAKGLEEGLEEGLKEGMAKGLAEGRAEGQREVAKKMKAEGLAPELISCCTGLSVDEIGKL